MLRPLASSGAILLLGCLGCNSAPPATSTQAPATPDGAASASIKPADIRLTTGDEKTLDALIAGHKGKVVFVDYWATWCGPCVEYFPHTVEMGREYGPRGLATIAVSFDEPDTEAVVRDFLAKQGVTFENLLSKYGVGPEAAEKFGIDQVPHFRLYDRQGQLRHKWDAKPDDAEQKIEELLAEKAE